MPAAIQLDEFVKQLEDSGILARGKLESLLAPEVHPRDAEELARALVKQNQLTEFQAALLLAGKTNALIMHNYTILDRLGAGGMGQVFKAEHRRMKRLVALKMLPTSLSRDPAALARFEREVEAAAQLSHPNIVAAYDADEANGTHFLVMEYIDGRDLSALVKTEGPLTPRRAVGCILQAARGLEFAHKKGVIHRDVKPSNLLLDSQGTIKVLDMGLARIDGGAGLTGTGEVMGTVDYMAPEQAISARTVDARADIYSLGCALHYLVTGKPPYVGPSLMDMLLAHQSQPIPSLSAAQPAVSTELDAVFRKLVAKARDERHQTMTEVIAALGACPESRDGDSLPGPPGGKPTISDQPTDLSIAMGYSPLRRIDTTDPFAPAAAVQPARPPKKPSTRGGAGGGKKQSVLIAAAAGGLVLALFAVWVIVRDRRGPEVWRLPVPDRASVTVTTADQPPAAPSPEPGAAAHDSPPEPKKPPLAAAQPFLPGIIPQPKPLAGNVRWQLERLAPTDLCLSACISPDGQRIACLTSGGTIRIYDVTLRALEAFIKDPAPYSRLAPPRFGAVAWSPDSRRLASGSPDGMVRLWEADGTPGPILKGHTAPVFAVAWSPDGRRLASGGGTGDHTIRIWESDGTLQHVLEGHSDSVLSLAWSPDGERLVSGSGTLDQTVRFWNADGSAGPVLKGHVGDVTAVSWNPSGKLVASGDNKTVRLWNADGTAATPAMLTRDSSPRISASAPLAWSPDGERLATAGGIDPNGLLTWQSDGTLAAVFNQRKSLRAVAWKPASRSLLTVDDDSNILFRGENGNSEIGVLQALDRRLPALAWIHGGASIALLGARRTMTWNAHGMPEWVSNLTLESLAWSEPTHRLALGGAGPIHGIWIVEGDGKNGPPTGFKPPTTALAWNPAGTILAAVGPPDVLYLWNADGPKTTYIRSPAGDTALAWSPDGQWIASGGRNNAVLLTKADKTAGPTFQSGTAITFLAWAPDSRRLAIVAGGNEVKLWQPVSGQTVELKGHIDPVRAVAWSPDGRRLVSGGDDGTLRFWDQNGQPGLVVERGIPILSLAWSPRGSQIACGLMERTVELRSAASGAVEVVIVPFGNGQSATFSASGTLIQGDSAAIETHLVYRRETPRGGFEVRKPSASWKRVGGMLKNQPAVTDSTSSRAKAGHSL